MNVSYDGAGDTYAQRARLRRRRSRRARDRAPRGRWASASASTSCSRARASRASRRRSRARARSARARRSSSATSPPAARRRSTTSRSGSPPAQATRLRPARCDRSRSRSAATGRFHLRIDCALVPFLSTDPELAADPGRLERFGVFGCEAAGALAAVTVDGHVAPCSFAPATGLRGVDLADGHAHDHEPRALARLGRRARRALRVVHVSARVCKGGCKVVTSFVEGAHGPDPECPRVVDARRAAS